MRENSDITVLVVDDEEQLRKSMVRNLTLEDFNVLSASSGDEAFTIIKDHPEIDFVLSDMRMPNGSGMDLLKNIRQHNQGIPVVLIVTGHSEHSQEEVTSNGGLGLLNKPVDIDEVVKLIKSTVG
jgi:DNA-binding NtrC family response regulator